MAYDPSWSATAPMRHQQEALELALPRPAFALFMEQGTGKTKVLLDKTVALFREGRLDGLLVVAPNGVHRNWIVEEAPKHLPPTLPVLLRAHRAGMGKREQATFDEVYVPQPGVLRILAINVEALSTSAGAKIAARFLKTGRIHTVVDESSTIKTPTARRTRAVLALGKQSAVRSIATGTPITQGPLDLYSQFEFLSPGYLGPTYTAFKNRYAEWRERTLGDGHRFRELVRYRNLPELIERVHRMSFQVTKAECLDLPPKVYERRPVELGPEQRRAYRMLVASTLAEFSPTERITTPHTITRILRLQQIVGGFLPLDGGALQPMANAKLAALEALLDDMNRRTKVIIWARFRAELDAIVAALRKRFGPECAVRYWGDASSAERASALLAFQDQQSPARFFVGQQQAGGMGLTLHAASHVIYYSNNFSWADRIQSEDRAHRIGQQKSVTYTDLVAEGTIDERILMALKEKRDMADMFRTVGDLLS